MARASLPLLTLTIAAAAALVAHRLVSHTGGVATAAGRALGATRSDAALGDDTPVDVLGTTLVEAGGLIAAGAAVEVGADGKAVTLNAGVQVGSLAPGSSSSGDGDLVEVILIPN